MITGINPLVIFFASILTSNMILSNFLGMCSYISISGEYKTASSLGKSVTLVMVFTTVINYWVYKLIIVPLGPFLSAVYSVYYDNCGFSADY